MTQLLLDLDLKKADGTVKKASDALAGKRIVALYFSAHWCPPCRQFTPILKEFYEEVGDSDIEVIFVSFDESEQDLNDYLKESHGDWYHIPFGSSAINTLKQTYDVSGIPMLIVVRPNGDVVTKKGKADVMGKAPKQTLSGWLAAAGH
ncbi:unnamed protein product [Thelazia callipaeda]|uniref:protein-disulfide reductase n=1 Tax=Thelazia callipaeda TaxID=103827 RepID=A0A0N5DAR7_THECL|nr:unnamed protein product [Thelazia callipaeda]